MASSLTNKVAMVTGGTAGIGRGVALELARRGASIALIGRNVENSVTALEMLAREGAAAEFFPADVLSAVAISATVEKVVKRFGRLDIVVASAGANSTHLESEPDSGLRLFAETDPDAIMRMVTLSGLAKLNPARAAAPHMIEAGGGSIIFITSEGGRVPTPGQTAVAYASGGLIMATKVLAKELAGSRIRVNTVSVTLVEDTPSWDRYVGRQGSIETKNFDRIRQRAPFGLARPEEIAGVVSFLASSDADFVTGATISATGGLTFP